MQPVAAVKCLGIHDFISREQTEVFFEIIINELMRTWWPLVQSRNRVVSEGMAKVYAVTLVMKNEDISLRIKCV